MRYSEGKAVAVCGRATHAALSGSRLPDSGEALPRLGPGQYARGAGGLWWGRPPVGGALCLGRVVEHEDGTVSAARTMVRPDWSGRLVRGVWYSGDDLPPTVRAAVVTRSAAYASA